jgi:hypothetical protein
MNVKLFFLIFLFVGLMEQRASFAQSPAGFKLPDSFQFDYTVTQTIHHVKKMPDSSVIHFFYTKTGDYAAAEISRSADTRGNLFIVITREGNTAIFDDRNKTITVISIRKLVSELGELMKWIRMDSVVAHMRKRTDGKAWKSVKTGNQKQLGKYTSEEYIVTDSKGHNGSVWSAKMDFNTQGDYMMSALGGNLIKMMSSNMTNHPLLQALTQPRTLITGLEFNDSAGTRKLEMQTQSIDQVSKTVSISGYTVTDYSNMTLPEIFQAEMKKKEPLIHDGQSKKYKKG